MGTNRFFYCLLPTHYSLLFSHLVRRWAIGAGNLAAEQPYVHPQLRAVMNHVAEHHLAKNLVAWRVDECLAAEDELPVLVPLRRRRRLQLLARCRKLAVKLFQQL